MKHINHIFFAFLLAFTATTMSFYKPSTLEEIQEARTRLAIATRWVNTAEQIQKNLSGNPEENEHYKATHQEWDCQIKKFLPDVLVPTIIEYGAPWFAILPYNLYNYLKPYTPDIADISPITLISYFNAYHNFQDIREKAAKDDPRNTPEFWQQFLEHDKRLCLQFIETNRIRTTVCTKL